MAEIKYIFHLGIVLGMSPIVLLLFILLLRYLLWSLFAFAYKGLSGKAPSKLSDPPSWMFITLIAALVLVAAPLIAYGYTQGMGGLESLNQEDFTMHGRHTGSFAISDELGYILGGFGLLLYLAYLALLLWMIYDELSTLISTKVEVHRALKQSREKNNDRPKILGDR